MKAILLAVLFLFTLVAHAQLAEGTLSSQTGFVLNTKNDSIHFAKGERPFAIDTNYNLFGQSDVIFVINNHTISVPVPSSVYKNFKNHENFNVTAQQLKLNFGMKAKRNAVFFKKKTQEEVVSCTFCGYCFGINANNGQSEYSYQPSCPGTREILSETSFYNTVYQIDFTDKNGKVIGTYQSKPIVDKKTKEIKELRSCL